MRIGPLGIWEIILIVGVALLIFGPVQLPKIARGVGKAVRSARDLKDEVTGVVIDDERPRQRTEAAPPAIEAPAPGEPAATPGPSEPQAHRPVSSAPVETITVERIPDRPEAKGLEPGSSTDHAAAAPDATSGRGTEAEDEPMSERPPESRAG